MHHDDIQQQPKNYGQDEDKDQKNMDQKIELSCRIPGTPREQMFLWTSIFEPHTDEEILVFSPTFAVHLQPTHWLVKSASQVSRWYKTDQSKQVFQCFSKTLKGPSHTIAYTL